MTVSIRNKHLRIRSRTDSRLVRKARILNHPGPKLEPSPPAFDGTDHSKRYLREPHREVLALRGLAMRGHLAPRGTRRTRRTQQWEAAVAFLARHGDNGVVWNVLSFWRATK